VVYSGGLEILKDSGELFSVHSAVICIGDLNFYFALQQR